MPSRQDTIDTLLSRHGRLFAEDLAIDIERGTPSPLFQLLVASILFGARINTTIAAEATSAVFRVGWTTPAKLAHSTWKQRVDVLNSAGYPRYDDAAAILGDAVGDLLANYGGDLRQLRLRAQRAPARERQLLKEFNGLDDAGVDFFHREVQLLWDELFPFADQQALEVAGELGLGRSVDDLRAVVDDADLPRLCAALVRARDAGDLDAIRAGNDAEDAHEVATLLQERKTDLYDRARALRISGRSKMDKQELAEAIARRH
ncbi:MAG: hypothetical protein KY462_10675 [Actinobacteria bacterium]|nr:hypothetical protein [Actinomycetota bacterium]